MSENYLNLGGTIRCCLATETLERVSKLFQPLGITRVANVTGLDTINIPTAICIRPNSKHLSVSQGKGLTLELAKISAIMESIEGYHAENPRPADLIGSFTELAEQYPAIAPGSFSSGFFPATALNNRTIPWIQAIELNHDEEVYIPHALVCLDSTQPHPEYSFMQVTSNGLASGNSKDEAICHALYEIVERDALARWLDKTPPQQQQTKIDPTTINSKLNQKLLEKYHAAEVKLDIWDITSELGIPTYRCAIENSDIFRNLGLFYGTGSHLSKEIALARALTEAAQTRLTLISGSRDDVFPSYYENKYAMTLDHAPAELDYTLRPQPELADSFTANLTETLSCLQQHNCQKVFVVDHTKPQLNIAVVHAFIPGLQFIGTRHGL